MNLGDTTAVVVGCVIGTGIFLKTAQMAQTVGSPQLVLLAWLAAGLLSLAGALSYAELGAMMPRAGGDYVFLRTAYGNVPAFLFGWTQMAIGATGGIASLGVAFALFLSSVVPLHAVWLERTFTILGETISWKFGAHQIVAVGIIVCLAAINCMRVSIGGRLQSILTLGKVLGIAAIIVGVLFFAPGVNWENFRAPPESPGWTGFKAFGAAMLAALWAYEGWGVMPMIAGEVKNPQRNIPRALILGMAVILTVYGLANLAYFYALPFEEIATSSSTLHSTAPSVAAKAARTFLPGFGAQLVSIAALISIVGILNGAILTSSRIPYAMARDGLWFSSFGRLHATTAVPIGAICLHATWASVLALSATFDQLTDSVVFAGMMFYATTTSAVFVLRRKMPDAPRPYKTFGYPIVPLLFIVVALWLVVNSLLHSPLRSVLGLGLIALGLPVYFTLRWRRGKATPAVTVPTDQPTAF